jgi:hypothetical protein
MNLKPTTAAEQTKVTLNKLMDEYHDAQERMRAAKLDAMQAEDKMADILISEHATSLLKVDMARLRAYLRNGLDIR